MATMNISLPDAMKDWVEAQVQSGKYGNSSDYVRDLLRRDQEHRLKVTELQRLVQEGIDSGISPLTADEILAEARRRSRHVKPDAA